MTRTLDPRDPVALTQALIRCPSVTPAEGGALDALEAVLAAAGFRCERLVFSDQDTPDIDNLFARFGEGPPHLCFAGHTDVVPPGDDKAWSHPPFAGDIADGVLYGRGAVDMKGAVACFTAAALGYLAERGDDFNGSISLLITGDEEGPAVNGTIKVLDWMAENSQTPDHCVVGEPTNPEALGDAVKIGRRGSLNGAITVTGTQGHVAYPQLADNPVTRLIAILSALTAEPLDTGSEHFEPSNLEVTTVDVGNPAVNVIPASASALFNIRFNDRHSRESLEAWVAETAARAPGGAMDNVEIAFKSSGDCFLTEPGPLVDVVQGAVEAVTGRKPALTTGGGTSDARYIKDHCPVVEFGLVGQTMHQIDERVPLSDIEKLAGVYRAILDRYFAQGVSG